MYREIRNEEDCHYTNGHNNDLDRIAGKLYMHEIGWHPLSESQIEDLTKEGDELVKKYSKRYREESGNPDCVLYLRSVVFYKLHKSEIEKAKDNKNLNVDPGELELVA